MRTFTGICVVVALSFSTAGVTSAMQIVSLRSSSLEVSEDIDTAIKGQPDAFMDTSLVDEGQIDIREGIIRAPSAGDESLKLSIPNRSINSFKTPKADEGQKYSMEVRDEGDGAFRSLIHIPDNNSPKEFSFRVNPDFQLSYLEDGGIAVWDKEGNLSGTFASPWAVDAYGVEVDTYYVVEGNSIVQRVLVDDDTTFPVVADPFWIPALAVFAILYETCTDAGC